MEAISFQFYRETEFKEVELNGRFIEIPKDWDVVRLGDILTLKNGERPQLVEDGKYPVYGANGIMGYSNKYLVSNDFTVIIGRVGASGEVHLGKGKIWISDNAIYSESYDEHRVYLPFVYYLLKFKQLNKFATRTTHPIITQNFLKSFLISLPPLEEQKKIAHVLRTIDNAIEIVEKAIEKLERIKKAMMEQLLTKGIGHKEFKMVELDGRTIEIPKDWEIVKLKDVVKAFISGGTPSTKNPEYWDGDIPWITSAYISGYYITSGEKYITRKGLENSSTNIVPKDNIIIATRVGLGKAAINLIDIAINQDLTGLIIDKGTIEPEFLVRYLTSNLIISRIISSARGTTIKGITRKFLENLPIVKPPLEEQKQIAKILKTIDKAIELKKKKEEKLERMKKAVMDKLLTGQVRIR